MTALSFWDRDQPFDSLAMTAVLQAALPGATIASRAPDQMVVGGDATSVIASTTVGGVPTRMTCRNDWSPQRHTLIARTRVEASAQCRGLRARISGRRLSSGLPALAIGGADDFFCEGAPGAVVEQLLSWDTQQRLLALRSRLVGDPLVAIEGDHVVMELRGWAMDVGTVRFLAETVADVARRVPACVGALAGLDGSLAGHPEVVAYEAALGRRTGNTTVLLVVALGVVGLFMLLFAAAMVAVFWLGVRR
jgi:hypothetical protein